eukprot:jgi/Hompol1/2347/HPOL_002939-RA
MLHRALPQALLASSQLGARRNVATVQRPKEYLHIANVRFNPGSHKRKKREGRGGKGKTAGRGRKGFKARQGRARPQRGYEGGQTPIIRSIPMLGMQKRRMKLNRLYLRPLALDTLQHWIDSGRLDASKKITIRELVLSGCVGRVKDGVVLLATGAQFLKTPVNIEVSRASLAAIKAIEAAGGTVTTVYHNLELVRAALYPERYAEIPEIVVPKSSREIARYTDPERRGYLAPLVQGVDKKDMIRKILEETKIATKE